jgi:prophage maintenance system killer protein
VLHDHLIALHVGAAGVRDKALLASALARPRQHKAYGRSPDIVDLAAIAPKDNARKMCAEMLAGPRTFLKHSPFCRIC